MENNLTTGDSSLDKFLSRITTDVLQAALEKVSEKLMEVDDEEILLDQLSHETFKESVMENIVHYPDLPEIGSNFEQAYVRERCDRLVEDTLFEVHDKLKRIFESGSQETSNNIESSRKKIRVLDCIKVSDRLQAYFQNLSLSIIQNAFDKVANDNKHSESEMDMTPNTESDIGVRSKEGSRLSTEHNFGDNIDNVVTDFREKINLKHEASLLKEDQFDDSNIEGNSMVENEDMDSTQTKSECTLGSIGFTTANSLMYQTIQGDELGYDGQSSNQDSFFSANDKTALQENSENKTTDSAMFTTANEFNDNSSKTENSFGKEFLQDSTILQSTPNRSTAERGELNINLTLTDTLGPRQSTPVVDNKSNDSDMNLPSAEASNILSEDPPVVQSGRNVVTEFERTLLQELSGDESSLGDASSPRTLSRQSSAFGNVTLEFDTDWEASMKGMQDEAALKSKSEEKHTVILHELSFEDSHRLKAPELLCPVFLAVQDDDDDEEVGDEEKKELKRKRMSQSIDDLCEMISEDEDDDQDHPMRRRAMSLECKKPPAKEQRKKVPTRQELMTAFEELQNEIMEDEKSQGEEEDVELSEDEKQKQTGQELGVDQEYNGLDDPLRWHTVVFNGQHKVIDLKLLEPFLKVLTHGGYHHEGEKKTVIVVLTACNLPDKKMKRYPFLMEQLFFFIISTMDLLVTSNEYIFVYFHGGTDKNQSPSFSWLKKYYQYIDHRLRKSVTKVFVVHPNLWLKSVFRLCRPFLSSNFARKLKFVSTLKELSSQIETDFIFIPDEVIRVDPDYKKAHT